jgi:hypothetical protein
MSFRKEFIEDIVLGSLLVVLVFALAVLLAWY